MEVILADMAANYSEIYDVWCKDMIAQRMKMRMMAEKKKNKDKKKGLKLSSLKPHSDYIDSYQGYKSNYQLNKK